MTMQHSLPAGLARFVAAHQSRSQAAVVYDPSRWVAAFDQILDEQFVRRALSPEHAATVTSDGRRAVDRSGVHLVVSRAGLADDDQVLAAWLLVTAWGNGLNSQWGFRNAAAAVTTRSALIDNLRRAATTLRDAEGTAALADAHRGWQRGLGVGESFFTKWFAFAGRRSDRAWQPLILDKNVIRSMNRTLGVLLTSLAGTKQQPEMYRAYVEAIHEWAGSPDRAQQLEWALFRNDGRQLS